MTPEELVNALRTGFGADRQGSGAGAAVLVDLVDPPSAPDDVPALREAIRSLPFVVAAHTRDAPFDGWLDLVDVVVGDDEIADLESITSTNPIASTSLALLLRGAENRSVADGLVAESATYSLLQSGSEFANWRDGRPPRTNPRGDDDGGRVRVERDGEVLAVTLARPGVRNALDRSMRDALAEALLIAELDQSVTEIHLRGDGPTFCAGGDLDEMGSRSDPATAHLVRLQRSPARQLASIGNRTTAHLHGASRGSGVELPAFARTVLTTPDATFGLPEVSLGLIPGAGGTVSVTRRIGRHRTAWLALTGLSIDASTALEWGLVDDITPDAAATG